MHDYISRAVDDIEYAAGPFYVVNERHKRIPVLIALTRDGVGSVITIDGKQSGTSICQAVGNRAPGTAASHGGRLVLSSSRTRPLDGALVVHRPRRDGPLGRAVVGFT